MHNASVDGGLYLKMSSKSSQGYYQCRAVNVAGVAMSDVSFVQEAGMILSRLLRYSIVLHVVSSHLLSYWHRLFASDT